MKPRWRRAFTLIEIIAVMTLIAIFAGVIGYAFMHGGSGTVGLQAAQSTISSLLTLVRSQAAVSGRNAGLFVNVNSSNPERYLRFLVPAVRDEANNWVPLDAGVLLPAGCYIVPQTVPTSPWIETGADWTNLSSTALNGSTTVALMSAATESWRFLEFTPRGTVALVGAPRIVVATGRLNPPGATPLFVFTNPNDVCGVAVFGTGLTRLINDRSGF